jgi:VIT1/CCC1 family predicted Fe2+/Mn2+ transporter
VLGQLYRLRWQIAVPACVPILLALLLFDADALVWLIGFSLALLFWTPIVAAWWRGGRRARTAFREGLDGK